MRVSRILQPFALATALAVSGSAFALDPVLNWNPRTGDVWVDVTLRDINNYGYHYREPFIDELVRYYAAPRDLVRDLLINRNWAPGDVYASCAIAQIVGRPCRDVVDEWDKNRAQGWGVVAQRMGIKPGSVEFHRLKRGIVPTYDRWARPITLDRELERVFPGRGNPAAAHAGHGAAGKPDAPGQSKAKAKDGDKPQPKDNGNGKAKGNNGKGKG